MKRPLNWRKKKFPEHQRGSPVPDTWWTRGLCTTFALALHERFDLPIYALIEEALEDGHCSILHAVCYKGGIAWDADGPRTLKHLLSHYGFGEDGAFWSSDMVYPGELTRLRFEPITTENLAALHADFDPHPDALAPAFSYLDRYAHLFTNARNFKPEPEVEDAASTYLSVNLPCTASDPYLHLVERGQDEQQPSLPSYLQSDVEEGQVECSSSVLKLCPPPPSFPPG